MKRDYYEVLGVARDASLEDIKRAYKKLAIQHHPDRNPGNTAAEESFKEASEAYAVLCDADKRKRYDRFGHSSFSGQGPGGTEPIDFSSVAEILEGLLGDMFSRGKRTRGRDVNYDLEVSFEEAALGCEKTISVSRPSTCATCNGSGAEPGSRVDVCAACRGKGEVRFQRGFFVSARACQACEGSGKKIERPCTTCNGAGEVAGTEELLVKIPAGVEDGSVRTVRGAGERVKGDTGDLHVYVRVKPHPLFTREGPDVLLTVPISFPQAVLGSTLDVPTLEAKVTMKLPPGTQSGKVFRLRGKGIETYGGAGKGDQLVKVIVEVPEKISRTQRKLLEELAQEMGTETHPQQQSFLEKLKALFD